MLDALVAEARLRWGLDLGDGLQVIAAERLVGTPLEPSPPVLIVPAAVLRVDPPTPPDPTHPAAPATPPAPTAPAARARAPPGRPGAGGAEPLALLRRLYPAGHPVGRFGVAETTTIDALDDRSLATPIYLAPVAPDAAVASPWAM